MILAIMKKMTELAQHVAAIKKGEEPACSEAVSLSRDISFFDCNKRELFQYSGLMDVLMKVAEEDAGIARVDALKAIQNIARCDGNKRELFQYSGLIDVLMKVVKDDCTGQGIECY